VVSLGVDTFAGDPLSRFALQSADYLRIGERLAYGPADRLHLRRRLCREELG
jgi:acetoin utilization deacetylase AcuC-like enzyme